MRGRTPLVVLVALSACAGAPPPLSLAPGAAVAACPDTPNCVSTAEPADDTQHHAEPFAYTGTAEAAKERMKALVLAMPRTALVEETATTLHVTFTSLVFRFVDDVHFAFVPESEAGGRVEYRSASRVGRGDMGVNRARMEDIAAAWASSSR